MSKAETLLRIKEAEAQIRTVKEAAEREREQVLRVARREALELIDKARQEAEDRYREILASAGGAGAGARARMLVKAREEAAQVVARGRATRERAAEVGPVRGRGAARAAGWTGGRSR